MSSESNSNSGKVWGLAIVAGVIAFFVLKFLASYTFWPALLLAILIGILVAILLWIGFYNSGEDDNIPASAPAAAPPAATPTPEPAKPEAAPAAAAMSSSAAVAEKPAPKPAETKPAPKAATQKKPAAKKPAARKPAAKPAAKKTERKPVAKDGKPELLSAPRGGKADDLKLIKGVGPKLEKMLNNMGVYHFDQVASWRAKEVKWVDENLEGFKGRVSRDEWVKQAKVLAKGGTTEFAKKVKKGGVY